MKFDMSSEINHFLLKWKNHLPCTKGYVITKSNFLDQVTFKVSTLTYYTRKMQ